MALLRQIATLAGGTAVGQLIVLLTTPWLARMYTPAEFGEYATFLSLCGVFVTVACLRYDAALTAASRESIAAMFWSACAAILCTAAIATLVALTPAGSRLLADAIGSRATLGRIAAAAVFCGIFQLASATSIRNGQFGWSSLLRMLQPMTFSLAALALPIGLIDSCLLGYAMALPIALLFGRRLQWPGLGHIGQSAWRVREFPLLSLPTSILDAVSLAMPVWFISSRYSSMDAGNYAQVQRLVAAPLLLLTMAIAQVYLKRAGDMVRAQQSPRALQRRVVGYLLCGTAVLLLALVTIGSPILHWFLGERWRTDTAFLLLVFLPVAVRSCVSPVTGILIVRQRLRIGALWQAVYFLVTGLVFYLLAGRVPLEQLLIGYAMSEAICYGLYLYIADSVAG